MTHVSHPIIQRIAIIKSWNSTWFSNDKKKYRDALYVDYLIRTFLEKKLKGYMVDRIIIDRKKDEIIVRLGTSRPGFILGKEGDGIKKLVASVRKYLKQKKVAYVIYYILKYQKLNILKQVQRSLQSK